MSSARRFLIPTGWNSLAMKEALAASDFSLAELKTRPCTVYLVLPPRYLDVHGRFLRLFVNLALVEASTGQKQRYRLLMVLDEFYALGRMQFVAKAAGLLAGPATASNCGRSCRT